MQHPTPPPPLDHNSGNRGNQKSENARVAGKLIPGLYQPPLFFSCSLAGARCVSSVFFLVRLLVHYPTLNRSPPLAIRRSVIEPAQMDCWFTYPPLRDGRRGR
jgi:hypothetical protein